MVAGIGEGRKAQIEGIVTRFFEARGAYIYQVANESGVLEAVSGERFAIGEYVRMSGRMEFRGQREQLVCEKAEKVAGKRAGEIVAKVEAGAKLAQTVPLVSDETMQKLLPEMRKAAGKLIAARVLGRQMILRYNNDADGISAGIGIASVLRPAKFSAVQHNSAVYTNTDAIRDMSSLRGTFAPLLIIVDCCANAESVDALALVKSAGIEILIVDHHPPSPKARGLCSVFVTPWLAGAASEYPAGLLACEIAKIAGVSAERMDAVVRISLTGDKSRLYSPTEEDERRALALDFLAAYANFANTLEFFESVLSDESLLAQIVGQAREKMGNIAKMAGNYAREKSVGKFKVHLVGLDKLAKNAEFPSKGKITGAYFDSVKQEGVPTVVIGHGERLISFRANSAARDAGFNATKLIAELKEELKDGIESGGGHDVAASLRIEKEFEKIVLEEVLKKIEKQGKT